MSDGGWSWANSAVTAFFAILLCSLVALVIIGIRACDQAIDRTLETDDQVDGATELDAAEETGTDTDKEMTMPNLLKLSEPFDDEADDIFAGLPETWPEPTDADRQIWAEYVSGHGPTEDNAPTVPK